jgi:tetratricopeptide (TPR) repeat protein
MNRRQSLFGLTLLGAGSFCNFRAFACLWDSDTLRDEAKLNATDFDLITGQFPHHGNGYYQVRIKRLTASGEPADYQARNDLAVAHVRLEQWKEAQALLDKNLAEQPDDYYTLSNLGVLAKKQGDFAKAAEWMAKAIAIKPEGHMGLGDWYVKSLQYRAAVAADPKLVPDRNFLGEKSFFDVNYESSQRDSGFLKLTGERAERREKARRLLENDQAFADGFFFMGDDLLHGGDLNLALLAYKRAALLGHPNQKELQRRIAELTKYLMERGYDSGKTTYRKYTQKRKAELEASIKTSFDKSAAWLESFKKIESEMAVKSGDEKLTPEIVEQEMIRRGIKRYRP